MMRHERPAGHRAVPERLTRSTSSAIPALHSVGWFDNISPFSFVDYTALRGRPDRAALQYLSPTPPTMRTTTCARCPSRPEDDHDVTTMRPARMLPVYLRPRRWLLRRLPEGTGRRGRHPRCRVVSRSRRAGTRRPTWPPPGPASCACTSAAAGARRRRGPRRRARGAPEPGAGVARWVHDPARSRALDACANPFASCSSGPTSARSSGARTCSPSPASPSREAARPRRARRGRARASARRAASMHVFAKLLRRRRPTAATHMLVRGQRLVGARLRPAGRGHHEPHGLPVQSGHSLRLHVASSDFPLYLWHPGTDENPWFATEGTCRTSRRWPPAARPRPT